MKITVEDKYNKPSVGSGANIQIREDEEFTIKPAGHVFAAIEENGELTNVDLGKNLIVFEARLLIAQLLKFNFQAGDQMVHGITHLAVGIGGPYQVGGQIKPFDLQQPPVPGVDIYNENKPGSFDKNGDGLSDLITEVFRKPVKSTYIDGAGNVTNRRTNVVEFAATFDRQEANGPLVEMAIFGGEDADKPNKGNMVAVKMFPVINKTASMKITFAWRLTF